MSSQKFPELQFITGRFWLIIAVTWEGKEEQILLLLPVLLFFFFFRTPTNWTIFSVNVADVIGVSGSSGPICVSVSVYCQKRQRHEHTTSQAETTHRQSIPSPQQKLDANKRNFFV